MQTLEIPREEWVSFFDSLSRIHEDEPIRIEILRADIGAQIEIGGIPLDGFAADLKGGAAVITIAAGSRPDDHLAHLVSDPQHVRILRGPSGDDEALEIMGGDESTTLVIFEGPKGWRPSDGAGQG
jgi:hypothetical protein